MTTPPVGDDLVTLRDWREDDVDHLELWLRPGRRWQDLDAPYFPPPTPGDRTALVEQMRERTRLVDLPTPRRGLVVAAVRSPPS